MTATRHSSRSRSRSRPRRVVAAPAAAIVSLCCAVAVVVERSSSVGVCVAAASFFAPTTSTTTFGAHRSLFLRRHSPPAPAGAAAAALRAYTDGDDRSFPSANGAVDTNSGSSDSAGFLGGICRRSLPPTTLPNGGRITLVGSGPGDPDLLTLAAYKLLSDPTDTLVIADRLVSPEILDLIQGEVKVANKFPGCQHEAQAEIYRWVKDGLDEGKHVVRLKIGDPFVFGRGGEEVLVFRSEYGVEPTVIPGVSAAFSAPLLGSIPVTHRGVSNQVVLCTGYGRDNTSPDLIKYHPEQTVVFLMAVGRLRQLSQKLIAMANFPDSTPVGIVERAGCKGQRTVVGTLDNIADVAERYDVKPPSTIVVGEVVRVLLEDEREEEEGGEVKGEKATSALVGLVQNATAGAAELA